MRGVADLQGIYGTNVNATLTQAGYTIVPTAGVPATAKTTFSRLYERWAWENSTGIPKRTDADFMKLTTFIAGELDLFWRGHLHAISSDPGGSGNIELGNGDIKIPMQMLWTYGRIEGSGVFIHPPADTMISPDHANWLGDPKKRNCLVSPTFGRNDVYGYHEGAYLDNVRFNGRRMSPWWDTSYESSGVVLWDAGEGSRIGRIKVDDFNDFGICLVRSTPADIENVSAFTNNRAAIGMIGSALGTIRVGILSGDDNPSLLEMLPGFGREAGGNLTVDVIKCESATIGEGTLGTHHKYKGQVVGKLRGQFNVVIKNLSYASSWIKTAHLFWIDDRLVNGTPQNSRLEVSGKGFGYAALLADSRRGIYFDAPPDYSAWHAVYVNGVLTVNGVVQTAKPFLANAGPMGFARAGETLNFANATPQQQVSGTAPPPPPPPTGCTWVLGTPGAWSACVGGSQSQTTPYVSSVAGCTPTTPKPADVVTTRACTVTPPPTGGVIATVNNYVNADPSKTQAVSWTGAKTFVFTGLKATAPIGYKLICGIVDTDGAGRGIMVLPDGKVIDNRISQADRVIAPAGTVVAGVAKTFTVTLSIPMNVAYLGTKPGTGGAFIGSIATLQVKP